jgi:dTDP-4-amino-4,6-dideoxygalactose transaminase
MIEYENLFKANQKFTGEFQTAFSDLLKSGWFVLGDQVKLFEKNFAPYTGSKSFVGVASGLDALYMALLTLDFPIGSEVIVPSNTYIATILAIIQAKLTPVLVEPDITTYNIDPGKIEQAITQKTKAIMPVHLYGKACDMTSICRLADKYSLAIIEDCAQAHGAKHKNKPVGSFGQFGAFSFYPTKNLGALGDAGGISVSNPEYEKNLRRLRNYGSDIKYYNEIVGLNSRLDEIQAAFLNIKFKSLDAINAHKRKLAAIYLSGLSSKFIKPIVQEDYFDVYHIFNVRHEKRDSLKAYLLENGIKTEVHYPVAPHNQKALKGLIQVQDFPISEEIHRTTLSLPISYFHTEEEVAKVVDVMNKF